MIGVSSGAAVSLSAFTAAPSTAVPVAKSNARRGFNVMMTILFAICI